MKNLISTILKASLILLLSLNSALAAEGQARIGFFSGTFDPPHRGHRELLIHAIRDLKLDAILVTPGAHQSHKPNATSFEIRDEMARTEFADIPGVYFLDETNKKVLFKDGLEALMLKLSQDNKNGTIFQIMGDDSLERLAERANVSFPKNVVVAVAERSSRTPLPQSIKGTPVVAISQGAPGLSSTQIRTTLAAGNEPAGLNNGVLRIIRREGLYGSGRRLRCAEMFR